jgi:hypothetical protein
MTPTGTLLIYAILGLVVAVAMALREPRLGALRLLFLFTAGVAFWPLFAPSLLGGLSAPAPAASVARDAPLDARIHAGEQQLLAALAKVRGVAEGALAPEAARVRDLAASLATMAARLAEIDDTLRAPELDARILEERLAELVTHGRGPDDPRVLSMKARLRNVERLRAMRARTHDDLERALLKMEEITSQMLLLKFAGRPESEVAALIGEIEGGVDGIAEAMLAVG